MATLTATPTISPSSLSISGKTTQNATITWSCPTLPNDSVISSCVLTGKATASMTKGNATIKVNGTTVSSGSNFSINLGTANNTSSVAVTAVGGNNNARGTVTFSNLNYTVTYTVATTYSVVFKDWDGSVLSEQTVSEGSSATAPVTPTRDGYEFIGWDMDFSNVTGDLIVTAQYKEIQVVLNDFPPFTDANWFLDSDCTNTLLETYSYGFTTAVDTGWIGYYIPVPDDWYGKVVSVKIDSITENASLVIQTTDTYDEIFALNSSKLDGEARIVPGKTYIIFLRTNYLGFGDVLVTGAYGEILRELENVNTLTISAQELTVPQNAAKTVKVSILPEDAMYNLTWEIDNPIASLGPTGLFCNILGMELGIATLTVTDTLTGLSQSCIINVVENTERKENIFPPFNIAGTWYLDSTCSLNSMSAYSCSFNAPSTWTGIAIDMPETWYGRKILLKCENLSANACFYIQEADTWSELGVLSPDVTTIELELPPRETYSVIRLVLQAPSTSGEVSITNIEAYYLDEEIVDNSNCVVFENRVVGYRKAEHNSPVEGAVICNTANDVINAIGKATAGQTIYLRQGIYTFPSTLTISCQGTSSNYISIESYPGENAIITGSAINFSGSAKYVSFAHLTISDLFDLHWGSAVKVSGGASYIDLHDLEIYNINCREIVGEDTSGCNPLVIYADSSGAITNITVENCYIHDCDTGWSEALTLNGNVSNCLIKNCTIKDITNIGIDLAGNYEWTGTVGDPSNQTHDCVVENCLIMNCQSPYATSAGLYSDGARDNTFRYNVIYNCQCGIELGSEQPGSVSENFTIYNNLIIDSGRCIGVGAYLETGAQNRNAYIYNNTFVCGDNNKENYGLYVERSSNVNFYNNIVYGTTNTKFYSNSYNSNVNVGNNCWYQVGGSRPSIDSTGIFADPLFVNNDLTINGDYTLLSTSLCINAGVNTDASYIGDMDLNGNTRQYDARIDIGAFENQTTSIYTVIFKDYDGTTLSTQEVNGGASAVPPQPPVRDGYEFIGWDIEFDNVRSDLIITAMYEKKIEESSSMYFGGLNVKRIYFGNTIVKAIYLGEHLIKK